jgi:hypothetical protein
MKLKLILEEINKDTLKSQANKFVNNLQASDFVDFESWLKLMSVSGKPQIPADLKLDYKMLTNLYSALQSYKEIDPFFARNVRKENPYLEGILKNAQQTLVRIGINKIETLIDVLYKSSTTSAKEITNEIKIKNYVFVNDSQMSEKRFKETCTEMSNFLNTFSGFHKTALNGSLEIHFKPSSKLKAKASYKSDRDQIWIKESNSREFDSTQYASLKYIISHELGHRYEKFIGKPNWFDNYQWSTTPYSKTSNSWDGEQFAELFALSYWGSSKYPQYKDKIEQFIKKMQ